MKCNKIYEKSLRADIFGGEKIYIALAAAVGLQNREN